MASFCSEVSASAGTETASIHQEGLLKEVADNPSHIRKIWEVMKINGPVPTAREVIAKAPLARLDYAELRDPETLAPAPETLTASTLLALAACLPRADGQGEVRLIDNRVLRPQQGREDRS